jgi:integrase
MQNLILRGNTWHFQRRVPAQLREFDSRKFVKFSLKTDSKKQAGKLADLQNSKLEEYWSNLIKTGSKHSHEYFKQAAERASILGFSYIPAYELSQSSLLDILNRILALVQGQPNEKNIEAVLGGVTPPAILISEALEKFFELSNDIVLNKSADQIRKWKNQRKRAVKYLIGCVGDKPLIELTREDLLNFRTWWINKIEADDLGTNGANKNFSHLKAIVKTLTTNFKLKIDYDHIFSELWFEDSYEPRPPFTTEHILNVLLNPLKLEGMNEEYQAILHVFAETGISVDEQLGILPEDIVFDGLPHVIIKSRKKNKLKTKFRARIIPLVGHALDAFLKYPLGFSHLGENPDSVSAAIGKYLSDNNMFPTEDHTTYSLRHSFQDRLTASECLDRVQVQLMGHKFAGRVSYGIGATLEQKHKEMKKIQLKID